MYRKIEKLSLCLFSAKINNLSTHNLRVFSELFRCMGRKLIDDIFIFLEVGGIYVDTLNSLTIFLLF